MESSPYALPVRHTWWINSTAEVEKENRPHQINLLELQSHDPLNPICLQSCTSEPPCIHREDCTDSQIEVHVDAIKDLRNMNTSLSSADSPRGAHGNRMCSTPIGNKDQVSRSRLAGPLHCTSSHCHSLRSCSSAALQAAAPGHCKQPGGGKGKPQSNSTDSLWATEGSAVLTTPSSSTIENSAPSTVPLPSSNHPGYKCA
jgi:hypothetical protein